MMEAQRSVDGLELSMLQLRRIEQDFLLHKDPAVTERFNAVLAEIHRLDRALGEDDNLGAARAELAGLDGRRTEGCAAMSGGCESV